MIPMDALDLLAIYYMSWSCEEARYIIDSAPPNRCSGSASSPGPIGLYDVTLRVPFLYSQTNLWLLQRHDNEEGEREQWRVQLQWAWSNIRGPLGPTIIGPER